MSITRDDLVPITINGLRQLCKDLEIYDLVKNKSLIEELKNTILDYAKKKGISKEQLTK